MNSTIKYILEKKEIESIKHALFQDLINELEVYYSDEPALYSTVWSFFDDFEKNHLKSIKRTKTKSDLAWIKIKEEYGLTKVHVSRILNNFITDNYKRHSILRDIGNSYALESLGFYKASVIFAGGVLEEIIRLLLESKKLNVSNPSFSNYLKVCEEKGLFKRGINRLNDFVREYRNSVHLARERNKTDSINQANAKNALASLFSVINEINHLTSPRISCQREKS